MSDRSQRAWDYPDDVDVGGGELIGYSVVATDGEVGKVDEATVTEGFNVIVVDTGPLIVGRRVLVPAGIVGAIDHAHKTVLVDRSTDVITNAPEFDPHRDISVGYRDEIADYYAGSTTTAPPSRRRDAG